MATAACSSDAQVAADFARVALKIILKGGAGAKGFSSAARKLGTSVEEVEAAVSELRKVLLGAAKLNLSEERMRDYLTKSGFHSPGKEAIATFYWEQLPILRSVVSFPVVTFPVYKSLEWRLDVQVASRSLRNQLQPSFFLKLTTAPNYLLGQEQQRQSVKSENSVHYLEADYATLKEICKQLEQALSESRASINRRILKQLK